MMIEDKAASRITDPTDPLCAGLRTGSSWLCHRHALFASTALLTTVLAVLPSAAETIDGGVSEIIDGTDLTGTSTGTHWTPWIINGTHFLIGDTGTGSLSIVKGGQIVGSTYSALGNTASGVGTATVTGSGSSWSNSATLELGVSGSGTLTIADGALVSSSDTVLGTNTSGTGTLLLEGTSGARGVLETGQLGVGQGTGTMSFDGGILRLNGDQANLFSGFAAGDATIGSGGAFIDTNGFSGASSYGFSGTGGLTKQGTGTLTLTGTQTYTGATTVEAGTLAIEGSINNTGKNLTVAGDAGNNGTLIIENGGSVTNKYASIASGTNSTGALSVTGAGSSWTSTSPITVASGNYSTGSLTISNGATVNNAGTDAAGGTGSVATLTVTGAGSTWSNSAENYIGSLGHAELTVSNGGTVIDTKGHVAFDTSSTATVTVTGAGSTWTNTGDSEIGVSGDATLTISNGGTVTNTMMFISRYASSTSTATVTGTGSSWTMSSSMAVGFGGDATLTISDGGTVNALKTAIGENSGSIGRVTVTGAGSTWANSTYLWVGYGSTGTLTVSNGGAATSAEGHVGYSTGSSGTATITGAGSSWVNSGVLTVGRRGSGTLTISDAGTVSTGTMVLGVFAGNSGTLNLDGTSGARGVLETTQISEDLGVGTVTFDGGILRLSGDQADLFASFEAGDVTISSGGAFIDTNGYTVASALNLSGTGGLTKQGAGKLTLTGDSSAISGTSQVSGGTLSVNGTLGGTINVLNGGTLGGSGTVGDTSVTSGGTIAPGNSIGTLTVAGDTAFASGSTYDVEVDNGGNSDLIIATGTAAISGGTVNVTPESGTGYGTSYAASTSYTILTATGGVTGTFDAVTDSFAFLDASLSYGANAVTLTLVRNSTTFADLVDTPNQKAVAGTISSLGASNSVYTAITNLTAAETGQAYDALSGEVHGSLASLFLSGSSHVRAAITSRIHGAFADIGGQDVPLVAFHGEEDAPSAGSAYALRAWGQAYGAYGETEGNGNAATVQRSTGGLLAGLEASPVPGARLGVFAGYGNSQLDLDARSSTASANSYTLGAYGGIPLGALGLAFGASYTLHDANSARDVAFTGFTDHLTADYLAHTAQSFGEVSFAVDTGFARLSPFAGTALILQHSNGFQETGGTAALTAASSSQFVGVSDLGLRVAKELATQNGATTTFTGTLGWRHAYGATTPRTRLHLAGATPFTVAGVPLDRDTAFVETGLAVDFDAGARMEFLYQGAIGNSAVDHNLKAELSLRF